MPGAERSTDSVNSYLSVQEGVANKSKMYASKYAQFVVSYAEEWYKIVSKRVGEGVKKAEEMRVELDHYQTKVEGELNDHCHAPTIVSICNLKKV